MSRESWVATLSFLIPVYLLVAVVLFHIAGVRTSKVLRRFHQKFPLLSRIPTLEDPEEYRKRLRGLPPKTLDIAVFLRRTTAVLTFVVFNIVIVVSLWN